MGIVHCDLKPENLLLISSKRSFLKLIDFGSSCLTDKQLYTYLQSRFYRAPEILLGLPYSFPIDMWSLGCIAAELTTGLPLFPGQCEMEQLANFMEILGPPPPDLLEASRKRKMFFDSKGTIKEHFLD